MHFLSDAIAEIEGLLEVNRDFCKKQMAEKASPALPTNCAVVPMIFVTSVDCICRCGGTAWVTYPSPLKDGGEVGHGLEATVRLVIPTGAQEVSVSAQMTVAESIIVGQVPDSFVDVNNDSDMLNLIP